MNNLTRANAFTPSLPITELNAHQVLALVNRWAKLKDHWFYEDRDALYQLKDDLIHKWVQEGTMVPVKVIERDAPAIWRMRQQIASNGSDLQHLNLYNSCWDETVQQSDYYAHYSVLWELVNGDIEVPLPEEEQKLLLLEYEKAMQLYGGKAQAEYQEKIKEYQRKQKEFDKYFSSHFHETAAALEGIASKLKKKHQRGRFKQAINWLKSGSLTAKQLQAIADLLKQNSFLINSIHTEACVPTLPTKPKKPRLPVKPSMTRAVSPENYVVGAIPRLDAAIAWAKKATESPNLSISEIDDHFICGEIQPIVSDEVLSKMIDKALEIFQDVLDGNIPHPKDAYEALTELNLCYQDAIGMNSYTSRWHETSHGDYCKWHEINLSLTGAWLVEFQSKIDESISFHAPYDRLKLTFPVKSLPSESSDQEVYGREISDTEQEEYPIVELLAILGKTPSDFPRGLQKYSKPPRYYFHRDWDDEYDSDFDDDDDWMDDGNY